MSRRLKSVINHLYKSGQTRMVFALSRAEAERLPAFSHVAVISITAPNLPLATLADFEHLLRMSFADVDHLSANLSAKAKGKMPNAFTPANAAEVIEFVEDLPQRITVVVAHCEGGYSRSCAIAQFLHERFGYSAELDRLTKANRSVIKLLHNAIGA